MKDVFLSFLFAALAVTGTAQNNTEIHPGILNLIKAAYGNVSVIGAFPNSEEGYQAIVAAMNDNSAYNKISVVVFTKVMSRSFDIYQQNILDAEARNNLASKLRSVIVGVYREKGIYANGTYPKSVVDRVTAHFVNSSLEQIDTRELLRFSMILFRGTGGPVFYAAIYVMSCQVPSEIELVGMLKRTSRVNGDSQKNNTMKTNMAFCISCWGRRHWAGGNSKKTRRRMA